MRRSTCSSSVGPFFLAAGRGAFCSFGARSTTGCAVRGPLLSRLDQVGPAALVGVEGVLLDRDGALGDGVEEGTVVGDEQDRAGERLERRLERLAALEVEMVRRLVEHEEVRARKRRSPRGRAAAARRPTAPTPASPARRSPRRGTSRAGSAPAAGPARSWRRRSRAPFPARRAPPRAARSRPVRPRGRSGSRRRPGRDSPSASRAASSCPSRSGRRGRCARLARSRATPRRAAACRPPRAAALRSPRPYVPCGQA